MAFKNMRHRIWVLTELTCLLSFGVGMAIGGDIAKSEVVYKTGEVSSEVGYSSYSYTTHPAKWGDTEVSSAQNRVPDLLPQNAEAGEDFEVRLGEIPERSVSGGVNPDAQDIYSIIWDSSQIPSDSDVDLVVFDLDGEFAVEEVSISSFFHTRDYEIPALKIWIFTNNGKEWKWVAVGSEGGIEYSGSSLRRLVINADASVLGTRLKISACSRNSSESKNFSLGGVTILKRAK